MTRDSIWPGNLWMPFCESLWIHGPETEKFKPSREVEHWYLSGHNPDTSSLQESFNMHS